MFRRSRLLHRSPRAHLRGLDGGMAKCVEMATGIILLPIYDPAMLAKQVASLSLLTDGRFILGVGVGGRKPDFDATHRESTLRTCRWSSFAVTALR